VAHGAAEPFVSREQIDLLVARSEELVSEGDVDAARALLQRAAEAGDARAALALGSTYDPNVLSTLHGPGVTGDAFLERVWYRKASAFGSHEAQQRLDLSDSRPVDRGRYVRDAACETSDPKAEERVECPSAGPARPDTRATLAETIPAQT